MYQKEQIEIITKALENGEKVDKLLNENLSPKQMEMILKLQHLNIPTRLLELEHLDDEVTMHRTAALLLAKEIKEKIDTLSDLNNLSITLQELQTLSIDEIAYLFIRYNHLPKEHQIDELIKLILLYKKDKIEVKNEINKETLKLIEDHPILEDIRMRLSEANIEKIIITPNNYTLSFKDLIVLKNTEEETKEAYQKILKKQGYIYDLCHNVHEIMEHDHVLKIKIKPNAIKVAYDPDELDDE